MMASGTPRHERPIWIWDRLSASFVWANGEGIKFWAAQSLEGLQASSFDKSHPAWMTVAQAFAGDVPAKGLNLDLAFPIGAEPFDFLSTTKTDTETEHNDPGVYHYRALCRLGNLKDRTAVIVELTEVLPLVGGKVGEIVEIAKDLARTEIVSTAGNSEPTKKLSLTVKVATAEQTATSVKIGARILEPSPTLPASDAFSSADDNPSADDNIASSDGSTEQMDELARMIQEASDDEEVHAETADHPITSSSLEIDAQLADEILEVWDNLPLDLTALKGASTQEEIEALLEACELPVAMVHLHRIIHANEMFVGEFGYGDINSLGNDGTDWILPQSRPALLPFYEANIEVGIKIDKVRICSGRTIDRAVYVKPIRLVKFDRVFLLLTVGEIAADVNPQLKTDMTNSLESSGDINNLPFLSAISHEMRTPLNVILGFSEMIAREELGPIGNDKYLDYVKDIHDSAEHALSLINDLLNLNKLRAGKWQVERVSLDLNEVVRKQVHLMRNLASRQGVRLRASMEENLPVIMADERSLNQILLNLLSNGIKFSGESGIVTVSTERQETGDIALIIKDTGAGMSPDELVKAMQPFEQTAQGAKHIGTGLGLTIAQSLAEANDISFSIESSPGMGTQISLLIYV